MKTSPADRHAIADEQASLWAARLEGGTLTAADRDALDAWLNADPRHRALLSQYCQFSADLEEQLLAVVASGGVELPPENAPVPRRRVIAWAASTALAAAAAVAVGLWTLRAPAQAEQHLSTAAGQRQSLTLADDTQVELNARTSLQVTMSDTERRVRLASGEAFFTVSKDARRPFFVETPAGSVRVTGTVFNVRTESVADLDVTVVEGSVRVHPGEAASVGSNLATVTVHALTARDRLTAAHGVVQVRALSTSDLEDALAWRQGRIVFHATPLVEALERFERYHGRRILVSPGVVAAGYKIGGIKNLDRLDAFLTDVRQTYPELQLAETPSGGLRLSLRSEQP